jgi:hypothetical protein
MNIPKTWVVLLALMLVAMAMVPMVSAADEEKTVVTETQLSVQEAAQITGADPETAVGLGGMEVSRIGTVSSATKGLLATQYNWRGYTDIWNDNPILGPVRAIHQSTSRVQSSGAPFDIDTIGARGRVWKDDVNIFDQPDTRSNSADAVVNYYYGGAPFGSWRAQTDHTFIYYANSDYWYPTTYDSM